MEPPRGNAGPTAGWRAAELDGGARAPRRLPALPARGPEGRSPAGVSPPAGDGAHPRRGAVGSGVDAPRRGGDAQRRPAGNAPSFRRLAPRGPRGGARPGLCGGEPRPEPALDRHDGRHRGSPRRAARGGAAGRSGGGGDRGAEPPQRPRVPHGRRGTLGVHDRRREPGCLTGAPMMRPLPNAGFHGGPVTHALAGIASRGKILSRSVSLRSVLPVRLLASVLAVLILSPALTAQPAGKTKAAVAGSVVLQAYTLRHQRASEAVALVYPLLSRKGTVELQPGGNTLVIRDVPAALNRIAPVLRNFDHAPRLMR